MICSRRTLGRLLVRAVRVLRSEQILQGRQLRRLLERAEREPFAVQLVFDQADHVRADAERGELALERHRSDVEPDTTSEARERRHPRRGLELEPADLEREVTGVY